ncbi:hypothetical protein LNKW23_10710 [Paralimibaculum aggregatum]|uniref:DUF4214 domain-containing protein n=1 Tax=Paralimibaculum aggregatum TaxID=3036245 RepID=A0ABQ6LEV2_9RHOB|nr:DUF4214 domain-containing protein [Limibaculum sp. NKW23]GMG81858.1 hypothetical protein LNKW23_10710 [Limibaculum sp. NKW23]
MHMVVVNNFVLLPSVINIVTGEGGEETRVLRADLMALGITTIQSITITDNGDEGTGTGRFTGIDLDGFIISPDLATTAPLARPLQDTSPFAADFAALTPQDVAFAAGDTRVGAFGGDLVGTDGAGNPLLGEIELGRIGNPLESGFLSLGIEGSLTITFPEALEIPEGAYLYLGEWDNAGEQLTGPDAAFTVTIEEAPEEPPPILGTPGDDALSGTPGDDVIFGGNGRDTIDGGAGNDTLNGEAGNDQILGGAGDDEINGGGARDAVVYDGARDDYTITENGGSVTVAGPGGETDTLFNVDTLEFAEGRTVFLTAGRIGTGFSATDAEANRVIGAVDIAFLYEAGLNRNGAIDAGGLNFWIDVFEGNYVAETNFHAKGQSFNAIAKSFFDSPEFAALVRDDLGPAATPENITSEQYLDLLYGNILGREPDAAGRQAWLDVLNDGLARHIVLAEFAKSPENQTTEPPFDPETLQEVRPGDWDFVDLG